MQLSSFSSFPCLIQCLCACHVTPGPATNWVSPSFYPPPPTPSLNATSLILPPPHHPPPTSLHRCLSVALSTAWSVPLSTGCMVVISMPACNLLVGGGAIGMKWEGLKWSIWYWNSQLRADVAAILFVNLILNGGFKWRGLSEALLQYCFFFFISSWTFNTILKNNVVFQQGTRFGFNVCSSGYMHTFRRIPFAVQLWCCGTTPYCMSHRKGPEEKRL